MSSVILAHSNLPSGIGQIWWRPYYMAHIIYVPYIMVHIYNIYTALISYGSSFQTHMHMQCFLFLQQLQFWIIIWWHIDQGCPDRIWSISYGPYDMEQGFSVWSGHPWYRLDIKMASKANLHRRDLVLNQLLLPVAICITSFVNILVPNAGTFLIGWPMKISLEHLS